jgi:hypothetical protein
MANVIDQTRKEGDLNLVNKKFDNNKNPNLRGKKPTNLVGTRGGPRAVNKMEMDKLNAMVASNQDQGKDKNKNIFAANKTPVTRTFMQTGGTVMPYRRAQEGNIALGGMPPPPPSADMVSPEMAEEAKNLGIEVAPPGATAEEVADDQLVLLSEGELVVPANVVRYHGLAQYEKMRNAALQGLDEMDKAGQLVSPQETPAPEGLVEPKQDMS